MGEVKSEVRTSERMLSEIRRAATYTRRQSTKIKMDVELEVRMFQKINEPAPNIGGGVRQRTSGG